MPLALVMFTRGVDVGSKVFVDRVEPANPPRDFGNRRPVITAVRRGDYIVLSTGQWFHTGGPTIAYWVES